MGIKAVQLSTGGSFQQEKSESEEEHLVRGSCWLITAAEKAGKNSQNRGVPTSLEKERRKVKT